FSFTIRRPTGIGSGATITAQEVTGKAGGTQNQPYAVAASRSFDFNNGSNLTQAGFLPVRGNNAYTSSTGFGWQAVAQEKDTGVGSNLRRDLHFGIDNTFRIQVKQNQMYNLRVYIVDPQSLHDNFQGIVEGGPTTTIMSLPAGTDGTFTTT